MIIEALDKSYQKPQRRLDDRLWVSDLGYHPRKAMLRVMEGKMETFDLDVVRKMEIGTTLGKDTFDRIAPVLGNALAEFPLYDEHWSGYADMVFGHGTQDVTIVEHKTTDPKYFEKYPPFKEQHICQLWLYGDLYQRMFGIQPRLILFYRAWQHWAEYEVDLSGFTPSIEGHRNGQAESWNLCCKPRQLVHEMEYFYNRRIIPDDDQTNHFAYVKAFCDGMGAMLRYCRIHGLNENTGY